MKTKKPKSPQSKNDGQSKAAIKRTRKAQFKQQFRAEFGQLFREDRERALASAPPTGSIAEVFDTINRQIRERQEAQAERRRSLTEDMRRGRPRIHECTVTRAFSMSAELDKRLEAIRDVLSRRRGHSIDRSAFYRMIFQVFLKMYGEDE